MPKYRCTPPVVTYFKMTKFLARKKGASGGAPGNKATFSPSGADDDKFESVMEMQAQCFTDIANGADIDGVDFSPALTQISELPSQFKAMGDFLLSTITLVNEARIMKKNAFNLAEQLECLQQEHYKLQGEYEWLKKNCDKVPQDENTDTKLCIGTHVDIDLDMVYLLYQHFFGYPKDGKWDESKAQMIRNHLENSEYLTLKEDGTPITIRHVFDRVKVLLPEAPEVVLKVNSLSEIKSGDTTIRTNALQAFGKLERFVVKFGQDVVIDLGSINQEIRTIVGFGSLILNQPCIHDHPADAIIVCKATPRFKYITGTVRKITGKFETYTVELDIGGTYEAREYELEDAPPAVDCETPNAEWDETKENGETCSTCGSSPCCCEVLFPMTS